MPITIDFFYVFGLGLHLCFFTTCVPGAHEGQNSLLNPLKLEATVVATIRLLNQTWASRRTASVLQP